MSSDNDWQQIIMPMIRNIMPSVIASHIVGVQPMTGTNGTGAGQIFDIKSLLGPAYSIVDHADVDEELWYTITCNAEVAEWIRTQSSAYWYEHDAGKVLKSMFDIHGKLYTLMAMRWEK